MLIIINDTTKISKHFISTEKRFRYDDSLSSPDGIPRDKNFPKTRQKKTSRHELINRLDTKTDRITERELRSAHFIRGA